MIEAEGWYSMSTVTNIMLSDDSLSSHRSVGKIQTILNLRRVDPEWVGGNKLLENNLYLGACSHFNVSEFLTKMKEIYQDVQLDDDVQLFIKKQDESKWTEIDWQHENIGI